MEPRIYYLYHWYGRDIKEAVPEAFRHDFVNGAGVIQEAWGVKVDDIHAFVEKYGNIVLKHPTDLWPYWSIYITDRTGEFRQKIT